MAQAGELGDLEQPHELRFQRREWQVARAAWLVLVLLLAATAAGAFGSGPLSAVTLDSASGALRVETQRFARFGASLRVTIATHVDGRGTARIALPQSYLDAMRIQQIVPNPVASEQRAGSMVFLFEGADPGGPIRVAFDLLPVDRGWVAGEIAAGNDRVDLHHLVYP